MTSVRHSDIHCVEIQFVLRNEEVVEERTAGGKCDLKDVMQHLLVRLRFAEVMCAMFVVM